MKGKYETQAAPVGQMGLHLMKFGARPDFTLFRIIAS
jgi:hypothetical protein